MEEANTESNTCDLAFHESSVIGSKRSRELEPIDLCALPPVSIEVCIRFLASFSLSIEKSRLLVRPRLTIVPLTHNNQVHMSARTRNFVRVLQLPLLEIGRLARITMVLSLRTLFRLEDRISQVLPRKALVDIVKMNMVLTWITTLHRVLQLLCPRFINYPLHIPPPR